MARISTYTTAGIIGSTRTGRRSRSSSDQGRSEVLSTNKSLSNEAPRPKRGRPPKKIRDSQSDKKRRSGYSIVSDNNSNGDESDVGGGQNDDDGEDADAEADDDEAEDEDDKPEVYAPSGAQSRGRGRQTGLSVSMAQASLHLSTNGIKRSRSSESDKAEGQLRKYKTPRRETEPLMNGFYADSSNVNGHMDEVADDSTYFDDGNGGYGDLELISSADTDEEMVEAKESLLEIDEEESNFWDAQELSLAASPKARTNEEHDRSTELVPDLDAGFFNEHFNRTEGHIDIESSLETSPVDESDRGDTAFIESRRVRFDVPETTPTASPAASIGSTGAWPISSPQEQLRMRLRGQNEAIYRSEKNTKNVRPRTKYSHGRPREERLLSPENGDTTDDEAVTLFTVRPNMVIQHSSVAARATSKPRTLPSLARREPRAAMSRSNRPPTMGSWVVDPSKPVAVVTGNGKYLLFQPESPRRSLDTVSKNGPSPSRGASFVDTFTPFGESDGCGSDTSSTSGQRDETVESDMNIRELFGQEPVGPPEAFHPFRSINTNGEVEHDDEENMETMFAFGDAATPEKVATKDRNQSSSEGSTDHGSLLLDQGSDLGDILSSQNNQRTHPRIARSDFRRIPTEKIIASTNRKTFVFDAELADCTLGNGIPALSRAMDLKKTTLHHVQA